MTDQIVINSLERALSGDVNDLQSMGQRQLGDVLGYAIAQRWLSRLAGPFSSLPASVVMGLAITADVSGTLVQLGGGVLLQQSAGWPASPTALESTLRVGLSRAVTTWPIGAIGASKPALVEARVVDNVTLTTTRDVFDVPTQTFIPQTVNKRVERQVELQITPSGTSSIPVFTGDPWVPLYVIQVNGSGLWTGGIFADLRRDLPDVMQSDDLGGLITNRGEGRVDQSDLRSGYLPGGTPDDTLNGSVRGQVGDLRYALDLVTGGFGGPAIIDPAYTPAAQELEHLYLVPLIKNGITIAPTIFPVFGNGYMRGVLVRANKPPSANGRTNSLAIQLASPWAAYDDVPAGLALHVASYYTAASSPASKLQWFTQDAGGTSRHQQSGPLRAITSATTVLTTTPWANDVDMRAKIPDNAKLCTLWIQIGAGSGLGGYSLQLRRKGATGLTPDNFPAGSSLTGDKWDLSPGFTNMEITIPVHQGNGSAPYACQLWEIVATKESGADDNFALEIAILGWSL